MDVPLNPFPYTADGITEQLFVGREELLDKFDAFLKSEAGEGKNAFWVVTGSRGQGKSSLFQAYELKAKRAKGVACGAWSWRSGSQTLSNAVEGLYSSIVIRNGIPSPVKTLSEWRYKVSTWFSDVSVGAGIFRFGLAKYSDRFKSIDGLIKQLTAALKPEVSTVVFLIDEVSIGSEITTELTKQFAQGISASKIETGRGGLNMLTVAFVQPQHAKLLLQPGISGPRGNDASQLEDFTEAEVAEVVQKGLKLANESHAGRGQRVSGEITDVANAVTVLAGGVPTLTLGLLYDTYEHMKKRVNDSSDAMPTLTAKDVFGSTEIKSSQVNYRLALFKFEIVLPGEEVHRRNARVLLEHMASRDFGDGPWSSEFLKLKMAAKIGTVSTRADVVEPVLHALVRSDLAVDAGQEIRFRGRILRRSVAHAKVT